jgi:hypothetical protein
MVVKAKSNGVIYPALDSMRYPSMLALSCDTGCFPFRGAEIKPVEPDPANTGEGIVTVGFVSRA